MMQKNPLAPRLFALVLSIVVAAGAVFAWALPAAAEDDHALEVVKAGSVKPDTPTGDDSGKTEEEGKEEDKTYTLTFSDGKDSKAKPKTYKVAYDGKTYSIGQEELFKKLYDGSFDGVSLAEPDPANEHIAIDAENKKLTVSGVIEEPITLSYTSTSTSTQKDSKNANDYPVVISAAESEEWDGDKTCAGEAIYGQSGTVDLTSCLPKDKTDTSKTLDTLELGEPTVEDTDSVLNGTPTLSDNKLSFKFVNDASKVGKTAKVTIPVTTSDDAYSPYEIEVTLTVLDKQDQTISADDVTGTVGDEDKSVEATLEKGDGTLSYEVIDGEDYVDVDATSGELTLKDAGTATVRVTASETDTYKATTKDVTVTVSAKPTYTVTLTDDGHGVASATPGTAEEGTTISLTATPDTGYEFKSWTVVSGDVTISDDSFEMPASDVEIKANFKKKTSTTTTCSITFKGNGGSGTMAKQTAKKGATITLKANKFKRTGYTFTGWNTKKNGTGSTFKDKAKVKLNANATLYAQWKKNTTSSTTKKTTSTTSKSSTSSSSSSKLAQTDDPNNFGMMAALAAGGAALVCAGIFASKKRGKAAVATEGAAEVETETKTE